MVRLRHIPAAAKAARSRDIVPVLALAVTLAIALFLRLYGVEWDSGYPFTPHPDERAILMRVGELALPSPGEVGDLLDADRSPLNPRWFPYGSFPLYLLKGFQGLLSALPGVEIHDLRVIGRGLSALADTATVGLVYLLGARLYGRREGLLAAILVARWPFSTSSSATSSPSTPSWPPAPWLRSISSPAWPGRAEHATPSPPAPSSAWASPPR